MSKPDILFICTGNIFRSMTAEYALQIVAGLDVNYVIHSAGLIDAPHEIVQFVKDFMAEKGVNISHHRPTKLTAKILEEADLAVAMDTEHRHQIKQTFNKQIPLFSEIAYGTEESVRDVCDVIPNWRNNQTAANAYGRSVMKYIFDAAPNFAARIDSFLPPKFD